MSDNFTHGARAVERFVPRVDGDGKFVGMEKQEDGAWILWTDYQALLTATDFKNLRDLYGDLRAIEKRHKYERERPMPFSVGL